MEFNREQQQAMEHKDGPMLVLAGPGSGKTEVIIRRTRKLIQNYQVAPSSILVVTFTKAAAGQMRAVRFQMLWPDMIWVYVLAYDVWNFQYTYLNLPTHSWYCGLALLLAPTFAAALWNKGGWIQNRANTLALWCMFAQVFPLFQDASRFTTVTSVYGEGGIAAAMGSTMPTVASPTAQGLISVVSFAVNVFVFAYILKRAKAQKKNPWKEEIFVDTKDYQEAMARAK